ncbi:MAG TPA: DUF2505 domain-containing protein [Actinomycetota bacterium]|nr:DUF2505 domain-containing protein [Actinomycetota bacterium]
MRFVIDHLFPAPVDDVARVTLDVAFQGSLGDVGGLRDRRVLDQSDEGGGRVRRRVRCVLDVQLPGAARALVGDGEPAWVEDALWLPGERTWHWVVRPEIGGDVLAADGAIALAEHDGGTLRRVSGRVDVRIPFYGGRVERSIVAGLRRAYDEEARRLAAWLDRDVTKP